MKKRIPIDITDFKEMIERNYYYFDKTKFIEEVIENSGKVKLFTRPRRFGKTLNLSLLKYFFDVNDSENNKKLFDNLYISKSESMQYQGEYPVIFLTLKDVEEDTWEECQANLKELMSELYEEYRYIYESDVLSIEEKEKFREVLRQESFSHTSLSNLMMFLSKYHNGKKVVILIDEYDSPIISAYENGYYEKAIKFFKKFYSKAVKGHPAIEFGVLTGILRIAKEGIFSGLNNLKIFSVLDKKSSDAFGFTETEIKKALEHFEITEKMEDIKEWYNGYNFGGAEIYNPWSILHYIDSRELGAYWIGTSNNFLINELLMERDEKTIKMLEKLFAGESIRSEFKSNLVLKNNKVNDIWQFFTHSGYLKVVNKISKDEYEVKIPNNEILSFFKKDFIEQAFGDYDYDFIKMIRALRSHQFDKMEHYLEEILVKNVSFFDTERKESNYHMFLLGMIVSLGQEYKPFSNGESGYGRFDISLVPHNKNNKGIILEFKVANDEEDLEEKANEGINQIIENRYVENMKKLGVTKSILIGIAFHKKKLKLVYKEI